MRDSVVRLSEVEICNFKNVRHGKIVFSNRRKEFRANVLGLYGQNGSGKTALIEALDLLKTLLQGKSVAKEMVNHVNVDADFARLKYGFNVHTPLGDYEASYEFSLRKAKDTSSHNIDTPDEPDEKRPKAEIFDECLSYSFTGEGVSARKSVLIDTHTDEVFLPAAKYSLLIGGGKQEETNLLVAKKLAVTNSCSFIFSKEFLGTVRSRKHERGVDAEFVRHLTLLENLAVYGNRELFVIKTRESGLISLHGLPLVLKYEGEHSSAFGTLYMRLNEPFDIPKESAELVREIISGMNIVLQQIVPGLTIGMVELGEHLTQQGAIAVSVQMVSHKNGKDIPLEYESEGIKKIIAILQLLIVVYNEPSITVAVDELDSGIFEYLLGEILRIISEKGKGQLIFTSHNLRPLETLDRGFIAFTTTNPDNRYIRMTNIKDSNNLRDFYYRDIVLGEQNEEVYKPTNNAEIALAFREEME